MIKAGDLVQVVHMGCTCGDCYFGIIRSVLDVRRLHLWCDCDRHHWSSISCARLDGQLNIPVSWLKRIDPLTEPVEHTAEETAKA